MNMNKPYETALEMVNEILERDALGIELRNKGKDGHFTWTKKDSMDAFRWLNGYVKALEDNVLITDEQSQMLREKTLSLCAMTAPNVQCDLRDIQSASELTANAIIDNCNVKIVLSKGAKE